MEQKKMQQTPVQKKFMEPKSHNIEIKLNSSIPPIWIKSTRIGGKVSRMLLRGIAQILE